MWLRSPRSCSPPATVCADKNTNSGRICLPLRLMMYRMMRSSKATLVRMADLKWP